MDFGEEDVTKKYNKTLHAALVFGVAGLIICIVLLFLILFDVQPPFDFLSTTATAAIPLPIQARNIVPRYEVAADGTAEYLTIQGAMDAADAAGHGPTNPATVKVHPGIYTEPGDVGLRFYDGIDLEGSGHFNTQFSSTTTNVFTGTQTLMIKNMAFTCDNATTAVFQSTGAGTVTWEGCVVKRNAGDGFGIFDLGPGDGTLEVDGCTLEHPGGLAIENRNGVVRCRNCTIGAARAIHMANTIVSSDPDYPYVGTGFQHCTFTLTVTDPFHLEGGILTLANNRIHCTVAMDMVHCAGAMLRLYNNQIHNSDNGTNYLARATAASSLEWGKNEYLVDLATGSGSTRRVNPTNFGGIMQPSIGDHAQAPRASSFTMDWELTRKPFVRLGGGLAGQVCTLPPAGYLGGQRVCFTNVGIENWAITATPPDRLDGDTKQHYIQPGETIEVVCHGDFPGVWSTHQFRADPIAVTQNGVSNIDLLPPGGGPLHRDHNTFHLMGSGTGGFVLPEVADCPNGTELTLLNFHDNGFSQNWRIIEPPSGGLRNGRHRMTSMWVEYNGFVKLLNYHASGEWIVVGQSDQNGIRPVLQEHFNGLWSNIASYTWAVPGPAVELGSFVPGGTWNVTAAIGFQCIGTPFVEYVPSGGSLSPGFVQGRLFKVEVQLRVAVNPGVGDLKLSIERRTPGAGPSSGYDVATKSMTTGFNEYISGSIITEMWTQEPGIYPLGSDRLYVWLLPNGALTLPLTAQVSGGRMMITPV